MANIHLIGGEKGGVGKSIVARVLAQYFIDRSIPFIGFDSDRSHGALMRFYGAFASPIVTDQYDSLDAIVEAATENPDRRVLVDLASQTERSLTNWMDESQLLEVAPELGLNIRYWHVMDSGKDSVDLLLRMLDHYQHRLKYVIVLNQVRGTDFRILDNSGLSDRARSMGAQFLILKRLSETTMAKIDACSCNFWAASQVGDQNGAGLRLLERHRFKNWLTSAYEGIDALGV